MKPLLIVGLFAVTEVTIAFVLEPLLLRAQRGRLGDRAADRRGLLGVALGADRAGARDSAHGVPGRVLAHGRGTRVHRDPGVRRARARPARHLLSARPRRRRAGCGGARRRGGEVELVEAAYDTILVPALARARHDREIGQLTPAEYAHDHRGHPRRARPRRRSRRAMRPIGGDASAAEAQRLRRRLPGPRRGRPCSCSRCSADCSSRRGRRSASRPPEPGLRDAGRHPGGAAEPDLRRLPGRAAAACGISSSGSAPRARTPRSSSGAGDSGTWPRPRANLDAAGADDLVTSLAEARVAVLRLTAVTPSRKRDREPITGRPGRSGAGHRGCAMTLSLGYKLSSEEQSPAGSGPLRADGAGHGLRLRAHLRSLPSVDRPAGSEPLRVERHRRHRTGDPAPRRRHRGHLPDHAHASGHRRPGRGDDGRAHARALLPRRGHGREPQRARRGRRAGRRPRSGRSGSRRRSR